MKNNLIIIKVGGGILNDNRLFKNFLENFSKIKETKILIHGGGIIASNYMTRLGIPPKLINGRRITDEKTLDVVIMSYAGLINKKIISVLQKFKCKSLGLSGVDCNLIRAKRREVKEIDFGFVGDIQEINTDFIEELIKLNITPVICSLSHDGNGQILNTNADTIASKIAVDLSKKYDVTLKYCLETDGVLTDKYNPKSLKKTINFKEFKVLVKQNIITDGMIPKIENCFIALKKGVKNIFIGNHNIIKNENDCTKLTIE